MARLKRGGPLQGVRVVELSKIWAGPETGKHLAFMGAEVIKIESQGALDFTRFDTLTGDINKARGFMSVNPQKLSAQIDIKTQAGVDLVLDLLRHCDMLVDNLRPGAMERLGLGWDAVRSVNPRIVQVTMGMYGNDGPLAQQTGYAPCFCAIGGLSALVGYKGKPPTGINMRYGDSTYGTAAAFAGLVALLHARRTGIGQFVDVSAVECMTTMIADTMMDYTLNGVEQACDGTRQDEMAPHGVYRCKGGDWMSIATSSDAAWAALAGVMGQSELADDARFATLAARKANEDMLDQLVSDWASQHDCAAMVQLLQGRGVAAGKSCNSMDIVADAQLWQRGFFPEVSQPDGTVRPVVGPGARISRPAEICDDAPWLGADTDYVLGDLLGLTAEARANLKQSGITG
jgi:crotonobetainyl-CoA:carnitine CoA-transferase CaiB-like acyl-CoA transferase